MPKYKYYKSDFPVLVQFNIMRETETGERVPLTTATPFNLRFYIRGNGTPENGYLASFDGEYLHNCRIISDNRIMVFVDRTQLALPAGKLMLEAEFIVADPHYEGDDENNIKRLYDTGIELTTNPDLDDESELTLDIFNDVVSYDLIRAAVAQATTTATATATTTATTVARQVAEEATSAYVFATYSDIDALWQ